ncbi:MAG: N-acetylglucosamine kinase [Desulfuromonadales bacterium C00003093]|nr:MAG: N-acetylglucosamine kinase [Desulfuromonadales bacterium C00003093]
MKPYQIGIDIGGTKTEAILFDPLGDELHRKRIPTPRDEDETKNYEAILVSVYELTLETAKRIPSDGQYTIGIGIPGTINRETHLVQNANTTCLRNRPFKGEIERRLGRTVEIENDANCFTLAESRAGAAQGYRIVLGVIMGTGCGGGICVDGKIHEGGHSIAGEWGHFSIDPNGTKCWCGNRGCIETKLSGTGVENAFFETYKTRRKMDEIVQGYRNQDTDCTEAFEQFLDDFGRCVGGFISILDPDAIVLGGGLSNIEELYTLGIDRMRRYAFHQQVRTPILKNSLGDSAGVYGAAWIGAS